MRTMIHDRPHDEQTFRHDAESVIDGSVVFACRTQQGSRRWTLCHAADGAYLMKDWATGAVHTLDPAHTSVERLAAHWQGFVGTEGARLS